VLSLGDRLATRGRAPACAACGATRRPPSSWPAATSPSAPSRPGRSSRAMSWPRSSVSGRPGARSTGRGGARGAGRGHGHDRPRRWPSGAGGCRSAARPREPSGAPRGGQASRSSADRNAW
jgi:hypothetical protein